MNILRLPVGDLLGLRISKSEYPRKATDPPPLIPPAREGRKILLPLDGGGRPARHREPLRRGGRGGGEIK
jgi:hypothetical protein